MKKANVVNKMTPTVPSDKGTVSARAASSKAQPQAAPKTAPPQEKSVSLENKQSSPGKARHPSMTTIVARINVGWGNQVFVRGQGGGLSWERGLPMTCNASEEWVWISTAGDPAFEFKYLLNDIFWENGGNHTVSRGDTHVHEPLF